MHKCYRLLGVQHSASIYLPVETSPLKKSKNIEISQAEFGGLWGKCFRGFGADMCCREPIASYPNKTGLAYIVQCRRQTAPRGGLSKSCPSPRQILWTDRNFNIFFFYGDPEPCKFWKCREKISAHLKKITNLGKFLGVTGTSHVPKFKKISNCPIYAWSKFGRARLRCSHFFSQKKTVFTIAPVEMMPMCTVLKWRKNSENGVGWCWWYSSTH